VQVHHGGFDSRHRNKNFNGLNINKMKTIKEAASELTAHAHNGDYTNFVQDAFKKGVEFAQRWTSVDEELPENSGEYLVKWEDLLGRLSFKIIYFRTKQDSAHLPEGWNAKYFGCVKFWRPIELK
jgi:hypothetical protein